MARAVLPRASAADLWLLAGQTVGVPESDGRARPLTLSDFLHGSSDEDAIEEEEEEEEEKEVRGEVAAEVPQREGAGAAEAPT